ncbi:hypothetical protein B484DRAFT_452733 [Ochromonadaceae sp. CCMP2298]|nr:hypothetical protein B484DRAFT_452733 [Ochromonadaceae sp. CCMP2298]|mmetsp:Transcript_33038/g.72768  ORF Transcript_33038/g.72768 Transcript_33038/m.72768 type:complete len:368 (+) Transcript_33038:115-1218(+)
MRVTHDYFHKYNARKLTLKQGSGLFHVDGAAIPRGWLGQGLNSWELEQQSRLHETLRARFQTDGSVSLWEGDGEGRDSPVRGRIAKHGSPSSGGVSGAIRGGGGARQGGESRALRISHMSVSGPAASPEEAVARHIPTALRGWQELLTHEQGRQLSPVGRARTPPRRVLDQALELKGQRRRQADLRDQDRREATAALELKRKVSADKAAAPLTKSSGGLSLGTEGNVGTVGSRPRQSMAEQYALQQSRHGDLFPARIIHSDTPLSEVLRAEVCSLPTVYYSRMQLPEHEVAADHRAAVRSAEVSFHKGIFHTHPPSPSVVHSAARLWCGREQQFKAHERRWTNVVHTIPQIRHIPVHTLNTSKGGPV